MIVELSDPTQWISYTDKTPSWNGQAFDAWYHQNVFNKVDVHIVSFKLNIWLQKERNSNLSDSL